MQLRIGRYRVVASRISSAIEWRWNSFLLAPFIFSWSPKLNTWWNRYRTRNPRGVTAKLHHKMAWDRRPLLVTFADKLASKNYAQETVGPERLPHVYTSATTFQGLDWAHVPDEFVLKVNHASGGVVVVTRQADPARILPAVTRKNWWPKIVIHPDSLNLRHLADWVDCWLGQKYRWHRWGYRQWAYSVVRPHVFVEEYLGGQDGLAKNLKFHTIRGRVASIIVSGFTSRFEEESLGKYRPPETSIVADLAGVPEEELEQIVHMSEQLAKDTDYVRVDWLLTPRGVMFGELTSYPAGGLISVSGGHNMTAAQVEALYDSMWELPDDYGNLAQGIYET
jgi:hypothetical protein